MKYIFVVLAFLFSVSILAQSSPDCRCCSDKHDDFDFWVGNWTVTGPDGNTVGTNLLEKIQDGCVLKENWQAANGKYTGTSFNFYNSSTQKWEQIWVDNNGGNLYLSGNRDGNQMILRSTELTNREGKPFYHQITWTKNEDGTVRQLWETFTEGEEVRVAFDGLYKKVQ
ncbi:MAG: hypothetical protein R3213_03135 [Flavobacteriaceae bacterium]|nr:hypothetical protein [Flavobacteriaceae bacterium]